MSLVQDPLSRGDQPVLLALGYRTQNRPRIISPHSCVLWTKLYRSVSLVYPACVKMFHEFSQKLQGNTQNTSSRVLDPAPVSHLHDMENSDSTAVTWHSFWKLGLACFDQKLLTIEYSFWINCVQIASGTTGSSLSLFFFLTQKSLLGAIALTKCIPHLKKTSVPQASTGIQSEKDGASALDRRFWDTQNRSV